MLRNAISRSRGHSPRDYLVYIYDWYEEDDLEYEVYYGVVVYVDSAHHEYIDDFIYEVLCLDGTRRYFIQSELSRM